MKPDIALVAVERHYKDGKPVCDPCRLFHQCPNITSSNEGWDSIYIPGPNCPVWHGNALRDALIDCMNYCGDRKIYRVDIERYLAAIANGTWPPKKKEGEP